MTQLVERCERCGCSDDGTIRAVSNMISEQVCLDCFVEHFAHLPVDPEGFKARCPRCLKPRRGNHDGSLSFSVPCKACGYEFIPEHAPKLFVYVCPYCGKQDRGPGGHHMAGDGLAGGCFHAHPGERGVMQPRLVRIEVIPAEPFELREIPHDRREEAVAAGDLHEATEPSRVEEPERGRA